MRPPKKFQPFLGHFWPFLPYFTLKIGHISKNPNSAIRQKTRFWLLQVNNSLCSIPLSYARSEIKEIPGDRCDMSSLSGTCKSTDNPTLHYTLCLARHLVHFYHFWGFELDSYTKILQTDDIVCLCNWYISYSTSCKRHLGLVLSSPIIMIAEWFSKFYYKSDFD